MLLDPSHPVSIWSIWPNLSLLERFSFFSLCLLGVYSLFLAATVVRLRNATCGPEYLVRVSRHIKTLRQATVAAFYFLGFVLFAGLQFAYFTFENSSTPVGLIVVRNFQIHLAFADNVFLVLLCLHFTQWFVANRVATLAMQSNS